MNGAHWHLIVNHLPIFFPMTGLLVLLTGILFKSPAVKQVALGLFIFGAVSTFAAMESGEGAEGVIKIIDANAKSLIHRHEEFAEKLALFNYALGAIGLVALWANWKQKKFAGILQYECIALAVLGLYFGSRTGTTGGEIRHTEIRTGEVISAPTKENEHD